MGFEPFLAASHMKFAKLYTSLHYIYCSKNLSIVHVSQKKFANRKLIYFI